MKASDIPSVSVSQMREIDRIMVEEIGISTTIMMENASIRIAEMARKLLNNKVKNKHITILSGKGNNGGDGLGAGRHLINWGAKCRIVLSSSPVEQNDESYNQYQILKKIGQKIEIISSANTFSLAKKLSKSDLVIDALLGYSLQGNPREPIATLIRQANKSGKDILAVDIPSGLDGDSGEALNPTIKAHTTITLALPKKGLLEKKAKEYVGRLFLADISIPQNVYKKLGHSVPNLFNNKSIIEIK